MPESRVIYRHPSNAETTTFNSGDLNTGETSFVLLLTNISAVSGTAPSMIVSLQDKDEAGNYYTHVSGAALSTATQQVLSIGPGCSTNTVLGRICRLVFTITGTTPSFTFEATLYGDV